MSFEEQLGRVLKQESASHSVPGEVDEQVYRSALPLLAQYRKKTSKLSTMPRFRWKNAMLLAVILVVISGFAFGATKIFELDQHGIKLEVFSDSSIRLTETSSEEVQAAMAQVRAQLLPGEYAVLYMDALTKEAHPLIREHPIIGVYQPLVYEDLEEWLVYYQSKMKAMTQPPASLGSTFQYKAGFEGFALDGFVSIEGMELEEPLRQEAKQSGQAVTWRKVEQPTLPILAMTTIYEAPSGEQVYVSVQQFEPRMKVSMYSNRQKVDTEPIGGQTAYYMDTDHHLSSSGYIQEYSWTAGSEQQPYLITVGTESRQITREQLRSMAEELAIP